MKQPSQTKPFSDQLETWLKGKQDKTLDSLIKTFGDKSFAIVFLLLMILPALPLPTGGLTHVFEVITIFLSLEMIVGRRTIWLPQRWLHRPLGEAIKGKVIPLLLRRVRWLEGHSSPRGGQLLALPGAQQVLGLLVLGMTLTALLSPPFSGLDTLPSLGVVLLSLALILDDIVLLLVGVLCGVAGLVLVIGFSSVILRVFHHFF